MITFFWLVFAHCIGDMVFQTPFIGHNKGTDWMAMISHIILYTGCIIIALMYIDKYHWWKLLFIPIAHLATDIWKSRTPKDKAHWHYMYYDQLIHLGQLIVVWF